MQRIGPYQVVRELGRGGMGAVYLCRDSGGALLAVKLIHSDFAWDEDLLERFRREGDALDRVRHPGVVGLRNRGRFARGWYLAMDYVRGESLAALLRRDGPLEDARVCAIGLEICDALSAAHTAGILHRDLKPENVLIDETGSVRLVDFGLALPTDRSQSLTQTGEVLGSPGYLAPEQCGAGESSSATDVYGLGALLYACCTGGPPFRGATLIQTLDQVLHQAPPNLEGRSHALAGVIRKCLQKTPSDRFETPAAVATALSAKPSSGASGVQLVLALGCVAILCAIAWHFGSSGAGPATPTPPKSSPFDTPTATPVLEPQVSVEGALEVGLKGRWQDAHDLLERSSAEEAPWAAVDLLRAEAVRVGESADWRRRQTALRARLEAPDLVACVDHAGLWSFPLTEADAEGLALEPGPQPGEDSPGQRRAVLLAELRYLAAQSRQLRSSGEKNAREILRARQRAWKSWKGKPYRKQLRGIETALGRLSKGRPLPWDRAWNQDRPPEDDPELSAALTRLEVFAAQLGSAPLTERARFLRARHLLLRGAPLRTVEPWLRGLRHPSSTRFAVEFLSELDRGTRLLPPQPSVLGAREELLAGRTESALQILAALPQNQRRGARFGLLKRELGLRDPSRKPALVWNPDLATLSATDVVSFARCLTLEGEELTPLILAIREAKNWSLLARIERSISNLTLPERQRSRALEALRRALAASSEAVIEDLLHDRAWREGLELLPRLKLSPTLQARLTYRVLASAYEFEVEPASEDWAMEHGRSRALVAARMSDSNPVHRALLAALDTLGPTLPARAHRDVLQACARVLETLPSTPQPFAELHAARVFGSYLLVSLHRLSQGEAKRFSSRARSWEEAQPDDPWRLACFVRWTRASLSQDEIGSLSPRLQARVALLSQKKGERSNSPRSMGLRWRAERTERGGGRTAAERLARLQRGEVWRGGLGLQPPEVVCRRAEALEALGRSQEGREILTAWVEAPLRVRGNPKAYLAHLKLAKLDPTRAEAHRRRAQGAAWTAVAWNDCARAARTESDEQLLCLANALSYPLRSATSSVPKGLLRSQAAPLAKRDDAARWLRQVLDRTETEGANEHALQVARVFSELRPRDPEINLLLARAILSAHAHRAVRTPHEALPLPLGSRAQALFDAHLRALDMLRTRTSDRMARTATGTPARGQTAKELAHAIESAPKELADAWRSWLVLFALRERLSEGKERRIYAQWVARRASEPLGLPLLRATNLVEWGHAPEALGVLKGRRGDLPPELEAQARRLESLLLFWLTGAKDSLADTTFPAGANLSLEESLRFWTERARIAALVGSLPDLRVSRMRIETSVDYATSKSQREAAFVLSLAQLLLPGELATRGLPEEVPLQSRRILELTGALVEGNRDAADTLSALIEEESISFEEGLLIVALLRRFSPKLAKPTLRRGMEAFENEPRGRIYAERLQRE